MLRNSPSLSTTDLCFIFESFQISTMLPSRLCFCHCLGYWNEMHQVVEVRKRKVTSVIQSILWRVSFLLRSSRPVVLCKKGVLRHFAKFTGKHLCQSAFFHKVAGLRPATLLKRDSGTGVFLWILQNFKEHPFS